QNNNFVQVGAVTIGDGSIGSTGFITVTNSVLGTVFNQGVSMVVSSDAAHGRLLAGNSITNRVTILDYAPHIVVEQPVNVALADGDGRTNAAPIGAQANLDFIIRNTGLFRLTGLGVTLDGADAASFVITTNPVAPLAANGSTTLLAVRFVPLAS